MKEKILLVEDEAVLAMSETQMLQKHGYEVVTAHSGEKALEIVDGDKEISLILMDIDLGKGIDGTEASQRILEKHDLPVVFLTSHSEREFVESVKKISGYGYILKNSGEFVLIESINMAYKLFESYKAIEKKEEQLSLAIDAEDHGYWDWNLDTNEAYFSSKYCTMLGYEPGELPKHYTTWENLLHPDDKETVIPKIQDCVEQTEPFEVEFRLRTKDGSWKWIMGRGKSYRFDQEGIPHRVVGTHEDIDEKKKIEEELKRSEARFRLVFDKAPIGMALVDEQGRPIMSNPALEKYLGYSGEELTSIPFSDVTHPEDREEDVEQFKKLYRNEIDFYSMEKRYIRKSGDVVWGYLTASMIRDHNGEPMYAVGMIDDVSASKKSEEKYRMLYENAPLPYQSLDEQGRFLEVNPSWLHTLGGYSKEEVIGRSFAEIIHPDYMKDFKRNLETFKKKGSAENNRYKLRKKNGEYIDVLFKGCISYSPEGEFLRTHCVFENITEKQKAEREIKEKSELLQNITDNMFDLVSLTDLYGNFTFVGKSHNLLGYDSEYLIGKNVLDFVHPEDLPRIKMEFEDFITNSKDWKRVEYRYRCEDGHYAWLETIGKILKDEDGRIKELLFSSRDISEKKKNLISLQESEEQLQRIMDSINDGIVVLDTDFKVVRTNRRLREDVGVESESQLLGKSCYEVFYGLDEKCPWCPSKAVLETGEEYSTTVPFPSENPQRWFHLLASPVHDIDGNITHVVESARDITSRKKAEEEKDELMRELNHRVKNNLLMISSLLRLKNDILPPEFDLSDIDRQITAIRLVHEKLHKTENISHIDMREYLDEILMAVFSFYPKAVRRVINIDQLFMESKKAVTVGLLVNEIATNAVKHGFSSEVAQFTLEMSEDEEKGEYVLRLSDTGSAFPEDVDIGNSRSLGLQLIYSLVGQLDGSIELQRKPVTTFIIRFPMGSAAFTD